MPAPGALRHAGEAEEEPRTWGGELICAATALLG